MILAESCEEMANLPEIHKPIKKEEIILGEMANLPEALKPQAKEPSFKMKKCSKCLKNFKPKKRQKVCDKCRKISNKMRIRKYRAKIDRL